MRTGYEELVDTLMEAYSQASSGKGDERHGRGMDFTEQPLFTIMREHGVGFATGQAVKKLGEAHTLLGLRGKEAAINELYGAIVYTAAAIMQLRRTSIDPVREDGV